MLSYNSILQSLREFAFPKSRRKDASKTAISLSHDTTLDILVFLPRKFLNQSVQQVNSHFHKICRDHLPTLHILQFVVVEGKERIESRNNVKHSAARHAPIHMHPVFGGSGEGGVVEQSHVVTRTITRRNVRIAFHPQKPSLGHNDINGLTPPTKHIIFERVVLTCQLPVQILNFVANNKSNFAGCHLELRFLGMMESVEAQLANVLTNSLFDDCRTVVLKRSYPIQFIGMPTVMGCSMFDVDLRSVYSSSRYLTYHNKSQHPPIGLTEHLMNWLHLSQGDGGLERHLVMEGFGSEEDVSNWLESIKEEFLTSEIPCNFTVTMSVDVKEEDWTFEMFNEVTKEVLHLVQFFAGFPTIGLRLVRKRLDDTEVLSV